MPHQPPRPADQHAVPRIPLALIAALFPAGERDEIVAGLRDEFRAHANARGPSAARRWLWTQALSSAPGLLRWTWWRSYTGYEPHSSAFRPRGPLVKTWLTDARYAARRLRMRPAYSLLAVLTLSLGIGGTAAVFGLARPLIFDPLPYANTKEVGTLWMPGWWTEQEFLYMRDKFAGFRAVGMYRPGDATMKDGDAPARLIPGLQVSAEVFDILGAKPLLGRTLQRGDDLLGAESAVVISYGLWQELGGASSVVGKRLMLDGAPRTVVGVMPRTFWFPTPDIRLWRANPLNPEGQNGSYALIGRVEKGVDVHHLTPQLQQITHAIGERFKYSEKADKTKNAVVTPLRDDLLGSVRPAIVATFVTMALILLIACANVAALMLGQVEGRATELAVRAALGATRGRLTQQIIIEALLVGVLAGITGAGLASLGFRVLAHSLPLGAWSESATFDWTMYVAALSIAVVAVLLVVLVPSVALWRGDLRDALTRGRTGGLQGRGGRLEHSLVVAEVALAMLIATGAGLLVRSVANRYAIDPGINVAGVGVVDVVFSASTPMADRRRTLLTLAREVAALPGVSSSALSMQLPLRGESNNFGVTIEGHDEMPASFTLFRLVSSDYAKTMGLSVRSGRWFTTNDTPDSTSMSIVINEAFARKYFPGENPIGRATGGGFGQRQIVVGVVSDASEGDLKIEREPVRYYTVTQAPWFSNQAALVFRTVRPQDAEKMLDVVRRTVQRSAPSYAVQGTTTMQRIFDKAVGPARQLMSLLALLSALALTLGAVGIYGVISHFATRRKRDWAIRVALGLPAARVVTHIVGQGVALTLIGVAFGALGAVALARLLATFLFGISSIDPLSFAAAAALLTVLGAVAAFLPAWRAGSVDPALALREQ